MKTLKAIEIGKVVPNGIAVALSASVYAIA